MMMRPGLLLTIAIAGMLFTSSCIKNEYYTAEPEPVQEPPPPVEYAYVFDDNFDDDLNGWSFTDHYNAAYVNILNGWLKYSYLPPEDGSNTVAINTGAKLHRNFLIQTRMKSDNAMGLVFGVSEVDYGYSFFIDNEGYFALYKEGSAGESVQTILDWQASSAIYSHGWNDIEFEQFGNYWIGYINGIKVFELPAQYIDGSQIGFIVLANTTGYADYLTVQW